MNFHDVKKAIADLKTNTVRQEYEHFATLIPGIASRDLAIRMAFVGGMASALGMVANNRDIGDLAMQLKEMNDEIYRTGTGAERN